MYKIKSISATKAFTSVKRLVAGKVYLILTVFVIIGVLCSFTIEAGLPPLIRFHVLANSDDPSDQALKYKVRDQIVDLVEQRLQSSKSLEDSRTIIVEYLDEIETEAKRVLVEEGSTADVKVLYGQYDFPTRYYGALSLPAGTYEAVRVVIGEGKGANWWCVLFPPLCFVDTKQPASINENEAAKKIKDDISVNKTVKIKPAFKVVEAWQDMLEKIAAK